MWGTRSLPGRTARTVAWYRDNPVWWEALRSGEYREYYERQYGTKLAG